MNPKQLRIVYAAITVASVAAIIAVGAFGVQIVGRLLSFFSPVVWPIAVAGISALILKPGVDFFRKRLKLSAVQSVLLLYILFASAVLALVFYVLPSLLSEGANLIKSIPGLLRKLFTWMQDKSYVTEETAQEIYDLFLSNAEKTSALAFSTFQELAGRTLSVMTALVGLLLVPIYLYYFLRSSAGLDSAMERLRRNLSFLKPATREALVYLTSEFAQIVVAFFRGQVLICFLTGVLYGAGFLAVGLNYGLVIGLSWGILNIVPYLGALLGLAVAVPMAFFQEDGGPVLFGLIAAVVVAVQVLDGILLTPKIMGKRTGLHPVMIILSILFWGKAFGGILGMLVGIPLTACLVTLWRWIRRKYLRVAAPT